MSDRIKGLTVVLAENMRDDDAENVINAIRMVKGVVAVESHIADMDHYMAIETARSQIGSKVMDVIYDRKEVK